MWAFTSGTRLGQPFLDRQIPSEELDDARHFGGSKMLYLLVAFCTAGRRAARARS
jgi:hypothetical protein